MVRSYSRRRVLGGVGAIGIATLSGCTTDGVNINVAGGDGESDGGVGIDIQSNDVSATAATSSSTDADSTSGSSSDNNDSSDSESSSDSSSGNSESRIVIEHLGSNDQVATYSMVFAEGSEVNHGGRSDRSPYDEIHGRFVAGRVSGDTDAFTFTGEVDKIDYTGCIRFTLDGDVIEEGGECGVTEDDIDETPQSDDPDDYRHHIKIEGRGPSGYTGDYLFYFTPGSNVTGDGTVSNYGTPYMYGTIVDGTQHFYYDGNITEWHYEGYLKITIDGEVVAESIPGREAQSTTYDSYTDQSTEYATDSPTEYTTSTEYPTSTEYSSSTEYSTSSPTESDTQTEYPTSPTTETATATATASPTETEAATETPYPTATSTSTPESTDADDNSTESS